MNTNKDGLAVGKIIKPILKEKSLSIRKLSKITSIDTSTISRIFNGKQQANIKHLEKFSKALEIPLERLLIASGYDLGNGKEKKQSKYKFNNKINDIEDIFNFSNILEEDFTKERIKKELDKYEEYILTPEGSSMVHNNFSEKIKNIGGNGVFIDKLKEMYKLFSSDNITTKELIILGSGLLYFIISTDIIPDFVFPIGFLDDVIAIKIVLNKFSRLSIIEE
ncbi:MAG: helix-turn-helix domain-containing protein [Clostridium argentinense]|nr:helix-turn-helix domain-containing protein [Clostridium argentinense]